MYDYVSLMSWAVRPPHEEQVAGSLTMQLSRSGRLDAAGVKKAHVIRALSALTQANGLVCCPCFFGTSHIRLQRVDENDNPEVARLLSMEPQGARR